jgi:dTDP-4-amino-4,6-dideoxygalactose transaminase
MTTDQTQAVPLCDIQASFRRFQAEFEAAIARVLASGHVILGPEVAALEREIADYCGVRHAVGCSSGSDALLLALAGLGIGPGDEVIMPPFTFFATAGAVRRLGAWPVFVDIDPLTFNIDPERIEERITDKTKAIIPVHLFGQCADMRPLQEIADRHGLALIEDAAQAFGADDRDRKAGAIGTAGCFSFYPTKTLGAFGDAGMVVTDDPGLAHRMASLRVHGMETRYHHTSLGWNARLDALHAAILRVKLPHVEEDVAKRREAARRYRDLIVDQRLEEFLGRPVERFVARHTFNQYVVKVANGRRDALLNHFKANGIGCEVYYPRPLHLQECLADLGHREGDFPVSEEMSQCVLALPIFPEITADQQSQVIDCAAKLLRHSLRRVA